MRYKTPLAKIICETKIPISENRYLYIGDILRKELAAQLRDYRRKLRKRYSDTPKDFKKQYAGFRAGQSKSPKKLKACTLNLAAHEK